ncbi:UNVERIFIED_CONTAM: hypothetical protein HDU68_008924 [Siphonaria sp. JEL0065]|nr:hypothetical protein HDU68_008924 [Siphonaria sp. JEL0065]
MLFQSVLVVALVISATNAIITNGAHCSDSDTIACAGTAFAQCAHNTWYVTPCAAGTVCQGNPCNFFQYRPAARTPGIIGYVANWDASEFESFDLSGFTAINYGFYNATIDGSLLSDAVWADNALFPLFQEARRKYPNLRTVLSFGGWSGSQAFSAIAASANATARFAKQVHAFLDKNEFDGVDIDWEFPYNNPWWYNGLQCNTKDLANDLPNFTKFLAALRKELGTTRIISIAGSSQVSAYFDQNGKNYVSQYAKYLSYIQVMTYDYYGAWSPYSDFESPLYSPAAKDNITEPDVNGHASVALSIQSYIAAGVPAQKLTNGLAFNGRSWSVTSVGENNGLYQLCSKPGQDASNPSSCPAINDDLWADPCGVDPPAYSSVWTYKDLRTQGPLPTPLNAGNGWTRKYFDFAEAPSLFDGHRFISYDDPQSIEAKSRWANVSGLGGSMIWALGEDYKGELIEAVYKGWK